ncbi:Pol, partial [Symbiodinium sp. CCMP2456]
MDEAADLVAELLPHRQPGEVAAMARDLGAWKRRGEMAPSLARQLSDGMPSQSVTGNRGRPDPGAIFTALVESSPAIALEGLKRSIKARRLAQAGRDEREKEARERWGLELVTYIKEANLPCAERMSAMGGHNNQWLRLFGNRRSKTLRNRAMSWRGFRSWLQVTQGKVWPSDVGSFLKYLEERHEVQPLGKTVPGSLLSSLSLLESVGQVPSSDRYSHDNMLIESARSWQAELEAGALPVKQAPMYTVAIMLACELVVRKSSIAVGYRVMAFILLVMDCDREYMDAEGLSLQVRRFLSELRTPFRHEGRWGLSRALLIPGAMVRYWTGHSGRHTLPSLSAAIEVGKEKRDFLGRWAYSQHGSQDYVLTARQVVHGVQNHVCKTLLEGSDSGGYMEEETLSELEAFARAHDMDLDFLEGHRILKWDSDAKSWKLG